MNRSRDSRRWGAGIVLVALAAGVGGCSEREGVATYPVEGSVVVRGEPAAGAFVVFHPAAEGAERPTGQVGIDGTFRLSTLEDGDGAPAGDYAVTIEWWKTRVENGEALPGANVVPAPYGSPETSPLTVTVIEGENRLDGFQIR